MITQIEELKQDYISNKVTELSDKDISFICALVREVSQRTIELRHYDSQIIGGIALYHGFVAEMKTGEGKTLVATIPMILNFVLDKKNLEKSSIKAIFTASTGTNHIDINYCN